MDIPKRDSFQPSHDFFTQYIKTRKKDFPIGGRDVKGLFSDADYPRDKFWFNLAVFLEIIGVLFTIYGGVRGGSFTIGIIAILIVIGLVLVDMVWLAPLLHRHEGEKNLLSAQIDYYDYILRVKKNLLKYLDEETDDKTLKILQDEIKETTFKVNKHEADLLKLTSGKNKFINRLIVFGLIIIAFIKTSALLVLATFDSIVAYFVFLLVFLIIVYAHVFHTAYAQAYMKAEKILKEEYKRYLEGNEKYRLQQLSQIFNTDKPLNLPIETQIGHKIVEAKDSEKNNDIFSGNNYYKAIYNGVPFDKELIDMTQGQEEDNKLRIFYAGRNVQFDFTQKQSTKK